MNSALMQSPSTSISAPRAPEMIQQPKEDFNVGHAMSPRDPDNPFNWPLYRRVYASAVSYAFGFAVWVLLRSPYILISSHL